jgi:hypothetical protein
MVGEMFAKMANSTNDGNDNTNDIPTTTRTDMVTKNSSVGLFAPRMRPPELR